ncbi:hypothetical protein AK812_SmicGene11686 [Symbiodinium microadriaticum]|uniref:Uncharacterized protein n=1 Tax=Symbiodinium microadriaticum TaxID=2951 RepID=A0A1Q9ECP1_SYMMI|nr:hypothetical protein AK812_SmicGene11686 [Symbiodinium microadriaticum]
MFEQLGHFLAQPQKKGFYLERLFFYARWRVQALRSSGNFFVQTRRHSKGQALPDELDYDFENLDSATAEQEALRGHGMNESGMASKRG